MLNTVNSIYYMIELQGFNHDSIKVFERCGHGHIVIVFYKQRFKAWRRRKEIHALIHELKTIGTQVDLVFNIFNFWLC